MEGLVTLESVCGHCCSGCLQRACWPCEPSPPLKQSSLIACRNWSWPSTSWWDITAPNLPHSSVALSSSPSHCVSVTAPPAGQTEETHTESKCVWTGSFPLRPSGAGKSCKSDVKQVYVDEGCLTSSWTHGDFSECQQYKSVSSYMSPPWHWIPSVLTEPTGASDKNTLSFFKRTLMERVSRHQTFLWLFLFFMAPHPLPLC